MSKRNLMDTSPILLYSMIFVLVLFACKADIAEIEEAIDKNLLEFELAENVEMLYSDSAVVKVRVKAPQMRRYLDRVNPRAEFPVGVDMYFFQDKSGSEQGHLAAKYAVRYEDKQEVIVRDSVVYVSNDGQRLETEELIWDEKNRKAYSDKFVKITRPGEVAYGMGFEANDDFSTMKIKVLTGKFKIED